jgi:hypothetical protein
LTSNIYSNLKYLLSYFTLIVFTNNIFGQLTIKHRLVDNKSVALSQFQDLKFDIKIPEPKIGTIILLISDFNKGQMIKGVFEDYDIQPGINELDINLADLWDVATDSLSQQFRNGSRIYNIALKVELFVTLDDDTSHKMLSSYVFDIEPRSKLKIISPVDSFVVKKQFLTIEFEDKNDAVDQSAYHLSIKPIEVGQSKQSAMDNKPLFEQEIYSNKFTFDFDTLNLPANKNYIIQVEQILKNARLNMNEPNVLTLKYQKK